LTIRVSVGRREDIDAAVEIFERSGWARRGTPVPKERLAQVRATIERVDTWFFLASDEHGPVGMAVAMPSRERFGAGPVVPGLCYLDLIFVLPERWGQHVGALLLDTVIADARGRGFTRIHLLTHDNNGRAHALYSSRGFTRTGWTRQATDPTQGTVSEWARPLG
jgi:GNAT superfamily N-acetyltransferase